MFKKSWAGIVALAFLLAVLPLRAQDKPEETSSEVPALSAFHEVIYPIWHTAFPQKDIAALKGFVPEIQKLAQPLYQAKLPGILRDRQQKWDAGLAELRKAVDAYASAASDSNDQALLDAAEVLHMRYEMMVRLVRPLNPEVDAFHKELYVIYHKYLPAKDWSNVCAASAALLAKAEATKAATLSRRQEAKKEVYLAATSELCQAVQELVAACAKPYAPDLSAAVEKVHTRYQALEKVFD